MFCPRLMICLMVGLLLTGAGLARAAATAGPVVKDGKLYRDGKPYRAFGLNVRDLADDILDQGAAATESFACIRWLGEKKVPFIRFWGSYFDNRRKYLENPEQYWRHMDLLVDACEKANVGLAPTLFWNSWNACWDFGEFCCDWADEDGQTRKFTERYTREFVTRYKDRPVIWFYEFSNENNLGWDLPNAMEFVPKDRRDARNIGRSFVGRIAIRAFGQAVRRLDATRPISSGCSDPRGCQYHLATVPPGGASPWTSDTPQQTTVAAGWTAPDPVDLLSMHYYTPFAKYDPAAVRAEIKAKQEVAASLGKPLYLGELGVLDEDVKVDATFNDALYKQRVRDLFQALYEAKVPLANWWVYAVKPWGFGLGALNPAYGRFDYVVDLIQEYNDKMAADTAREAAAAPGG